MATPVSNRRAVHKDGKAKKAGYAKLNEHLGSLSSGVDYPSAEPARGRKRGGANDPSDTGDASEGTEVTALLDRFGADINKALIAKRKRLETFTKSSLTSSHQAIEQLWKTQQNDRMKLTENYCSQFNTVFQQWDSDLQKSREQDEKLTSLFRQQQKMFQQMRTSQAQRLKSIKLLLEQYVQNLEEMEKSQSDHHVTLQTELRQEMTLLQKKLLMETQHRDIATVRKSLQTMLL